MNRGRSRSPIRREGREERRGRGPGGAGGDRTARFDPDSDRLVFVQNLPFDMSWFQLKDVIRDKGGEVAFAELLKTADGRPKGSAIVQLVSREAVGTCIDALHQQTVGGRTVSAQRIRDPVAFFRNIKTETGVDYLEPPHLGLRPPLVPRVFVTNISYSCGVGKLFDVFRMAGRIEGFDLQLDADGKTKGMALIDQRLLDRTMTVKMDRFEKEDDRDRNGIPNGLRGVGTGLGANGSPLQDLSVIFQQQQQAPVYAAPVQPVVQPAPVVAAPQQVPYDPPQYAAPAPAVYNPPPRQLSPPPTNGATYYGQSGVYSHEPAAYKPQKPAYNGTSGDAYGAPRQEAFGSNGARMSAAAGYGASAVNGASGGARGQSSYSTPAFDHPTRVLVIKNLPVDYSVQVIAGRLQVFGDFESVELLSPGVAKVRFLHVQDAEKARQRLHNTQVEESLISVDYSM
ncbi:SUPpressor [Aphelenchoides fujianensis]|nr:SUPpressor [Aphelenchoides fujianensis]